MAQGLLSPEELLQRAVMRMDQGNLIIAARVLDLVLYLRPNWVEALNQQGKLFALGGEMQRAELQWLSLINQPTPFIPAGINLSNLYIRQKRFEEAEHILKNVLAIAPGNPPAHTCLSQIYTYTFQKTLARYHAHCALQADPNFPSAVFQLARIQSLDCDTENAISGFRKVLKLKPSDSTAAINLASNHYYRNEFNYSRAKSDAQLAAKTIANGAEPYTTWKGSVEQDRKLNIGFVSGDFYTHSVMFFLEPVLQAMDKTHVDLHAFSNTTVVDATTHKLKNHFMQWTDIHALNDLQAAQAIHSAGIDILIDLAGYTASNRLGVFAYKAAPVQVTWLGFVGTTGMPQIDYLIADPHCILEEEEVYFTEQIWRMSESRLPLFNPNFSTRTSSKKNNQQAFVFGTFQNIQKINPRVLKVWSDILKSCPESHLRIQSKRLSHPEELEQFRKRLLSCGLPLERCELYGSMSFEEYIAAHAEIDLILDTFPFTGGTTTNISTWLGVPTLTLNTPGLHGRQGAQLLSAASLTNWICKDIAQYQEKAIYYGEKTAESTQKLTTLRHHLPNLVARKPASDMLQFAAELQQILREMWSVYCRSIKQ